MTLVVQHDDKGIDAFLVKHGVGAERAGDIDAGGFGVGNRRADDLDFLAAETGRPRRRAG